MGDLELLQFKLDTMSTNLEMTQKKLLHEHEMRIHTEEIIPKIKQHFKEDREKYFKEKEILELEIQKLKKEKANLLHKYSGVFTPSAHRANEEFDFPEKRQRVPLSSLSHGTPEDYIREAGGKLIFASELRSSSLYSRTPSFSPITPEYLHRRSKRNSANRRSRRKLRTMSHTDHGSKDFDASPLRSMQSLRGVSK